jgi:hypothetical protein
MILCVYKIGTKKYLKTIYLITAAEDEIQSPEDLQATVGHMMDQEINLVVIGINFTHTTASFSSDAAKKEDAAGNEEEEVEETVKSGNEKMLLSIVKSTNRGAVLRGDGTYTMKNYIYRYSKHHFTPPFHLTRAFLV